MRDFRITATWSENWHEVEAWLFENVGHGGRWLTTLPPNSKPLPENGDEWGIYVSYGHKKLRIVDEEKSKLFILRWL